MGPGPEARSSDASREARTQGFLSASAVRPAAAAPGLAPSPTLQACRTAQGLDSALGSQGPLRGL